MNPPLTPPRRGTDTVRTNACFPPGRVQGWVAGSPLGRGQGSVAWEVSASVQTGSPAKELRRGLHTWCRHLAGCVACSAGIGPAELFFNLSAGNAGSTPEFMDSHALSARTGAMNPPLTPPRRGTETARTNACSPLGRGWGWVGSRRGELVFYRALGT